MVVSKKKVDRELTELFHLVDRSKDGVISYDEFSMVRVLFTVVLHRLSQKLKCD